MKFVYFPFTDISVELAALIADRLGPAAIYQAIPEHLSDELRQAKDQGLIDIVCPRLTAEVQLKPLIREYLKWAEQHAGGLDFFQSHKNWTPFDDQEMAHKIRAMIAGDLSKPRAELTDALTNARIFLGIAQEFDRQRQEMDKGLEAVSVMERQLLENLKGEAGPLSEAFQATARHDPGGYMPAERLAAWAHLAASEPPEPGILITDSAGVMDYLKETIAGLETAAQINWPSNPTDNEQADRKKLRDFLEQLAHAADIEDIRAPELSQIAPPEAATAALEIWIARHTNLAHWLSGLTGKPAPVTGAETGTDQNMVIGFLRAPDRIITD